MQEVAKCPKGHGELRKDRDGYLVCPVFCGYEQPPKELPTEELPAEDPEPKGYEQAVRASQGFRYPEATKKQAVADVEQGAEKEEVLKRVGCAPITLDAWIAKYGKKNKVTASTKALKILLRELGSQRFSLLTEASILNSRIEAVKEAIKILEEAQAK